MSKPLKTVFKTKHEDKEVELAVVLPSAKIKQQGRHVHAKAYNNAIQAGAMLREELEGHLRNSKLWSDERQAEYDRLRKVLLDGEKKLAKRGLKLSEARDLAIEMSKARLDLQELLAQRNKVDQDRTASRSSHWTESHRTPMSMSSEGWTRRLSMPRPN
jgi:hypothetical protein